MNFYQTWDRENDRTYTERHETMQQFIHSIISKGVSDFSVFIRQSGTWHWIARVENKIIVNKE